MTKKPEAAPAPPKLKKPKNLHERDRRRWFPPGPRAQQWMIVLLLLAAVVSLVVKGANGPADP